MNRSLIIISVLVVLFGAQMVSAQTALEEGNFGFTGSRQELPEPVFAAAPAEKVSGSPHSFITLTELAEAVPFLWSYGAYDEAGHVEYKPSMTLAAAGSPDMEIPGSIRNNKYFIESVRLTNLAQQAYEEGDYDASTQYSEDAVRNAQLSDEYVNLQLKIKAADDAIAAARRRLDYAASVNASSRYPAEYSRAQAAYTEARTLRAAESWDEAVAAANRVLFALAYIDREPEETPADGPLPLPAQYTVRPWAVSKDCLWNIAGRSWVYNDPKKWKLLYDANKSGMPAPDNPDLIHPGMILNIPSIKGEIRQGMWDASKTYSPLQ